MTEIVVKRQRRNGVEWYWNGIDLSEDEAKELIAEGARVMLWRNLAEVSRQFYMTPENLAALKRRVAKAERDRLRAAGFKER